MRTTEELRRRRMPEVLGRIDPYFAIGFGSVLALGLLAIVLLSPKKLGAHPDRISPAVLSRLRTEATGQTLGSSHNVQVVELTDYECPACATAHREAWPIIQRYARAGAITYEVRNIALPGHPNAVPAAITAACVAAVAPTRFWAYHDRLFARQAEWAGRYAPQRLLLGIAADVGSDSAAVRGCVDARGDSLAAGLREAFRTASAAGFPYTPVWSVNGKVVLWRDLDAEIRVASRALD